MSIVGRNCFVLEINECFDFYHYIFPTFHLSDEDSKFIHDILIKVFTTIILRVDTCLVLTRNVGLATKSDMGEEEQPGDQRPGGRNVNSQSRWSKPLPTTITVIKCGLNTKRVFLFQVWVDKPASSKAVLKAGGFSRIFPLELWWYSYSSEPRQCSRPLKPTSSLGYEMVSYQSQRNLRDSRQAGRPRPSPPGEPGPGSWVDSPANSRLLSLSAKSQTTSPLHSPILLSRRIWEDICSRRRLVMIISHIETISALPDLGLTPRCW